MYLAPNTCTTYPAEYSQAALPIMDTSEAHRNATLSLLLPGRVLHLNALLVMRKFRDRGNKAGAVRGFEMLQEHSLGTIISTKPQRGTSTVRCTCRYCFQWWYNYKVGHTRGNNVVPCMASLTLIIVSTCRCLSLKRLQSQKIPQRRLPSLTS